MDVLLANPRGFCAGVDRAIEIVKRAIETLGAPIYVRHEVVHNRFVVEDLRNRGAVFVEELDEVPDNATVIFSAHGVSQAVRAEAAARVQPAERCRGAPIRNECRSQRAARMRAMDVLLANPRGFVAHFARYPVCAEDHGCAIGHFIEFIDENRAARAQ